MINLLDLPTDILLVIFSYILTEQLIRGVSMVCVEFRDILSSESFWKRRYNQQSSLTLHTTHDWKLGCCQNDNLQEITGGRAIDSIFSGTENILSMVERTLVFLKV